MVCILTINIANSAVMVDFYGRLILLRNVKNCTEYYELAPTTVLPCYDNDDLAKNGTTITQTESTEAVIISKGKRYLIASDETQNAVNKIFTEIKSGKKKYSKQEFENILKPLVE